MVKHFAKLQFQKSSKKPDIKSVKGDGLNCDDVNECEAGKPCGAYAICTNTVGSYECECKANFVMNTIKNKCERKNMCHDEPCGENSKCIPRGTDNFECKCRWGYEGKHYLWYSVISQL